MLADFFYIYIYFMKKVHIGTIYIYKKNTTLFLPLLVHFYFYTSFQQWM